MLHLKELDEEEQTKSKASEENKQSQLKKNELETKSSRDNQ